MSWEQLKALENPNQRDILIATPNVGTVSYKWSIGLRMLEIPPYFSWGVMGAQGQPIDLARNVLVTNALRDHAKYIFFLDSDVIPKTDTLIRLVKHNLPIVSGVYFSRANPAFVVANLNWRPLEWNALAQAGQPLVEVDEVGTGCLLIDMRVIERIMDMKKLKFFCIVNHNPVGQPKRKMVFDTKTARENDYLCPECKSKGAINILIAEFFDYHLTREGDHFESEDYYFCRIARDLGFKVFIDLTTTVVHESAAMHISEIGVVNPIVSVNDLGGHM